MIIGDIVDLALDDANAADPTIKAHCESKVALWLKDIVKQFRWDFMRKEATPVSVSQGDNSLDLASDYWKMISVVFIDSDSKRTEVELVDRSKFDLIQDLTEEGTPKICCVFGSELRFYPSAEKDYTVEYLYYRLFADAEILPDATAPFPDKIIEQVAYIGALQYDRIDTLIEERKLKGMLLDLRRGSIDEGISGEAIHLDSHTFSSRPKNYI